MSIHTEVRVFGEITKDAWVNFAAEVRGLDSFFDEGCSAIYEDEGYLFTSEGETADEIKLASMLKELGVSFILTSTNRSQEPGPHETNDHVVLYEDGSEHVFRYIGAENEGNPMYKDYANDLAIPGGALMDEQKAERLRCWVKFYVENQSAELVFTDFKPGV